MRKKLKVARRAAVMKARIRSFLVNVMIWVGAVAACALVLIGIPLLLWNAVGWPLPAAMPTVDDVVAFLTSSIPERSVLKIFVVVGWLSWVQVVYAMVVEFIAAARGRVARRIRGGFLSQRIARWIVMGLFRFGATSAAFVGVVGPAGGGAALIATAATASASTYDSATTATPTVDNGTGTGFGRVELDRSDPSSSTIVVGDESRLDGHVPYEVKDGDTLWGVAETHLSDPFRWSEIFDSSRDVIQPFAYNNAITDPETIWPGSIVLLPDDALNVPPVEASKVAAVYGSASSSAGSKLTLAGDQGFTADDAIAEALADISTPETSDAQVEILSENAGIEAAAPEPVEVEAPLAPESSLDGGGATSEGDAIDDGGELPEIEEVVTGQLRPSLRTGVFGAGGIMFASVVVAAMQRAKRQSMARRDLSEKPAPIDPELGELDTELRQEADVAFVETLETAWLSLSHVLTGSNAVPVLAMLSDDTIEVILDGTVAASEVTDAGWSVVDADGRSVVVIDRTTLRSEGLLGMQLQTPLPLMVAVSEKLLLNLEALGSLSVIGDRGRASGFVRSILAELLLSEERRVIVRVSKGAAERVGAEKASTVAKIGEELASWLSHGDADYAESVPHAFAARCEDPNAQNDPLVVVCDEAEWLELGDLREMIESARFPVSAIVLGSTSGLWTANVDSNGELTLGPDQMRDVAAFAAVDTLSLTQRLLESYEQMVPRDLDDYNPITPTTGLSQDEPATGVDTVEVGSVSDEEISTVSGNVQRDVVDSVDDSNDVITISVLGPLKIDGFDGKLTAVERSALSFLALCGNQPSWDIRTALYPEKAISDKSWFNMAWALRSKVGASHLPKNEGSSLNVRNVITDVALFEQGWAESLELSGEARLDAQLEVFDLVRGQLFEGLSGDRFWGWAFSREYDVDSGIEVRVGDAASICVNGLMAAQRFDDAVSVCNKALAVTPGCQRAGAMKVRALVAAGDTTSAQRLFQRYEQEAHEEGTELPKEMHLALSKAG